MGVQTVVCNKPFKYAISHLAISTAKILLGELVNQLYLLDRDSAKIIK